MKTTAIKQKVVAWVQDESAATSIEYALIAALIAIAIVAAVRSSGVSLTSLYTQIASALSGAAPAS